MLISMIIVRLVIGGLLFIHVIVVFIGVIVAN